MNEVTIKINRGKHLTFYCLEVSGKEFKSFSNKNIFLKELFELIKREKQIVIMYIYNKINGDE